MDRLKVSRELASRYLNDGFSGGEKKRVEILQMAMLRPKIAVLDETDSGLDIDALKIVAGGVQELVGPDMGALVITHYQRILELHQAGLRARLRRRQDRRGGRRRARREARGVRIRAVGRRWRYEPDRERDRPGDRLRLRGQVRLLEPGRGEGLLLQVGPRSLARARRRDLVAQERAGLDAEVPPQVARLLPRAADADLGRHAERCTRSTSTTSSTTSSRPRTRPSRGRTCPPDIKDTWDKLGIPEAEKKYLAGVGAQYESEVVYHKLQEKLTAQGVIFLDTDTRAPRARGHLQAVLRDDHPAERQQVRGAEQRRLVGRLVHLRAAGRPDRAAAPGLLPHQRGEHGPVRAHADHRRRGRLRALRRGLHRADLLDRLAALAPSSRSSSRRAAAAATRRSRTGRPTSTTSSRSARSPRRTRRWSGSTGTSARS